MIHSQMRHAAVEVPPMRNGELEVESHRLDRVLTEISPGEDRVLKRVEDPSAENNRWYRAMENTEVGRLDLFQWENRPSLENLPTAEHYYCKRRGIDSIAPPIIRLAGAAENHLDHYAVGDSFFLSERLFEVFQMLDPLSIEWVEADVSGASRRYFYCLCTRSLKALDERTTTILLKGKAVSFEDYKFAIADQLVPDEAHCFSLYYWARPLWSRELISAAAKAGAQGVTFWPPFLSSSSSHTIRI